MRMEPAKCRTATGALIAGARSSYVREQALGYLPACPSQNFLQEAVYLCLTHETSERKFR
jgi:hypothetical protein